jgi:thiol-disulfide isomerase/thioredoxin
MSKSRLSISRNLSISFLKTEHMRTSLLIAMIMASFFANSRQQLTVIDQDYQLALKVAAEQHKLLLIDFYTTWCIPCKELDKTIFQNSSIAHEIDEKFVVLKYDAEKDSVHNLSVKHHISSYPTTLVLTSRGQLVNKMLGLGKPLELPAAYRNFLKKSRELDRQGKYIKGVSAAIQPEAYPSFYRKYVYRTANIGPNDIENYWKEQKDFFSEVNFSVLIYFGEAPATVIDFFLAHKSKYIELYGPDDVQRMVQKIVYKKFESALANKNEQDYSLALAFAKAQVTAKEAEKYDQVFRLELYAAMDKWEEAMNLVAKKIAKKQIDGGGINNFCWKVYEKCNDKKVIGKSIMAMQSLVEKEPSFASLDTYARLLAKAGNKEEAIKQMKAAIAMGKQEGMDTKESEEALNLF